MATRTLSLSSPEGGSYVIVLTITKEYQTPRGIENMPSSSSSHLWNLVSQRSNYLLWGNENEQQRTPVYQEWSDRAARRATIVDSSFQGKTSPEQISDVDATVTSESFSNWTQGNDVDVLIDGLETFERMFEVSSFTN